MSYRVSAQTAGLLPEEHLLHTITAAPLLGPGERLQITDRRLVHMRSGTFWEQRTILRLDRVTGLRLMSRINLMMLVLILVTAVLGATIFYVGFASDTVPKLARLLMIVIGTILAFAAFACIGLAKQVLIEINGAGMGIQMPARGVTSGEIEVLEAAIQHTLTAAARAAPRHQTTAPAWSEGSSAIPQG